MTVAGLGPPPDDDRVEHRADLPLRQATRTQDPAHRGHVGETSEWVRDVLSAGMADIGDAGYARLIGKLHSLAREGAFEDVTRALATLDPAGLSEQTLVTLARGTFPFCVSGPRAWTG